MSIRVIVTGARGRMGQEAVAAIESDPSLELVGALVRGDDLGRAIQSNKAQVVVDLTTPESVYENARITIDSQCHPVIGASGLTPDQIEDLKHSCAQRKLGGIIAPNFSLGAILQIKLAQMTAAYFPDAEIIEMHHDRKLDAPSGTALKTAAAINAARKRPPIEKPDAQTPARGLMHQDTPIHSVRLPGLVAHQQVIFGGHYETLTLTHDSLHRQCFMPGILLACKKVLDLKDMVYGLEHLI